MVSTVYTKQSLPEVLFRLIPTDKVYLQEKDGEIRISPIHEGSGLRGLGVGCNMTMEKHLAYKRKEKEIENKVFGQ